VNEAGLCDPVDETAGNSIPLCFPSAGTGRNDSAEISGSDVALRRSTPLHEASTPDAPAFVSPFMIPLWPLKDSDIFTDFLRFR
jgi:hypothetical protein